MSGGLAKFDPPGALVPTADRLQVARFRQYFRITNAAQCRAAIKALAWLKRKIAAIHDNAALNDRIQRQAAALEASRAIKRTALAVFVSAEATIRDEVARFQSGQDRARRRLASEANAVLPQLAASLRRQQTRARVFVADDEDEDLPAPVTLAPLPKHGAGWRRWWRWTLVDPKKPTNRDGEPIENVEAGIKALAGAVVKGTAPWELLQINDGEAQRLVDTMRDQLQVPGLCAWSELRPIVPREEP